MFRGKAGTVPTSETHPETTTISPVNYDTYSIAPHPVIGKTINDNFSIQVNYDKYSIGLQQIPVTTSNSIQNTPINYDTYSQPKTDKTITELVPKPVNYDMNSFVPQPMSATIADNYNTNSFIPQAMPLTIANPNQNSPVNYDTYSYIPQPIPITIANPIQTTPVNYDTNYFVPQPITTGQIQMQSINNEKKSSAPQPIMPTTQTQAFPTQATAGKITISPQPMTATTIPLANTAFNKITAVQRLIPVLTTSVNNLKFQVDYSKVIGQGGFGKIYLGKNLETGTDVAVKVESRKNSNYSYILNEIKIYDKLKGGIGIPKIYSIGSDQFNNYLMMELLGPSLQKIFYEQNKTFPLPLIINIGIKIIDILEYIHDRNIIHGDIKPSSFLKSNYEPFDIFIIDFGFSREIDPITGMPIFEGSEFVGDTIFASKNSFQGILKSKRDDIESLGYMLIYFLKGFLPWEGSQNFFLVKQKKLSVSIEDLCSGLAPGMKLFMSYAYNLGYTEKPNYNYLRQLLISYGKPVVFLVPVQTFFPQIQPLIQLPAPMNIPVSIQMNQLQVPQEDKSSHFAEENNNKVEEFEQLDNVGFKKASEASHVEEVDDLNVIEKDYVGTPNSFIINDILRKKGPTELDDEQFKLYNALTRAINNNKTEKNYLVHRYVDDAYLLNVFNFNPSNISYNLAMIRQQIGSIKIEKGFMSCFMTEKHFLERNILLEIKIPKGTRAYITRNIEESEIILPCNTEYKIMDAKIINNNKIQIDILILNNESEDLFSTYKKSNSFERKYSF